MSRILAFIDTSIFLHYQPFDQIDWLEVLDADAVTLVIAKVVIDELDELKDRPEKRSRDRARSALKRFAEITGESFDGMVRDGVALQLHHGEADLDFTSHGLRTAWRDDRLLASIIDSRAGRTDEDEEVVLVARDVGPQLRARHFKIRFASLPKRLEIPDEPDPDQKRMRELERQIAELKRAIPDLRVEFASGKNHLVLPRRDIPSHDEGWIAGRMRALRAEYPKRGPGQSRSEADPSTGADFLARIEATTDFRISPGEFERYNESLASFYAAYERHLRDSVDLQIAAALTYQLDLRLINAGGAPAEDIDVFLHFPDGFELLEEEDVPELPQPPAPPHAPRTSIQIALAGIATPPMFHSPDFLTRPAGMGIPVNVSRPTIRSMASGYEVEIHVRRLKHHLNEEFDPLYVVYPSAGAARSFRIDYRINAGNSPKEVEKSLHVAVEDT